MWHGHEHDVDGPPRLRWSRMELLHLGGAVLILSLAFAVAMSRDPLPQRLLPSPFLLLASFVAVATGFVPHELAHKLVAQGYGLWAEFRGHFPALGLSFLLAAGTGILFAAPGAVLIQGSVSPRRHGIVSIVGPAMNILIALAVIPLGVSLNPASDPSARLWHIVAYVNGLLAVFNMLPFGVLDGRKVWHWNKWAYFGGLAAAIGTFVAVVVGLGLPAG